MTADEKRIQLTALGAAAAQAGDPPLRGHALAIHEATAVRSPAVLKEIENTMREVIFHSTLDWQDRRTFDKGAREAYGLIRLRQRRRSAAPLPEDEVTAALLGVRPEDVAALAAQAVQ